MPISFPKACTMIRLEIQITCLSDISVVRHPEISKGSILPLGPIWVNGVIIIKYPKV